MPRILIVDDEGYNRRTLSDILSMEKYKVDTAENGTDCLNAVEKCKYDVILLDIKMPKPDGMEVLEILSDKHPNIPVIMISGHGNIDTAVDAVKKGAFDYIAKPPDLTRLMIIIRNALDKGRMTKDLIRVKKSSRNKPSEMIGRSPKLRYLKSQLKKAAESEVRVLITGPNGSGKELVARNLHYQSPRVDGPFVEVNCAAIPSELIESVLFGHEKGAFTGAVKMSKGKFEQANGGTLFLDEIGDMSLSAQAKVLRALQENKISRVGSDKDINVNCRVITATNRDLFNMIAENKFRLDLYYRLAVVTLNVPSLNERREDIPLLTEYFIESFCKERNKPVRKIEPKAMKALQEFNYQGNIRELRNIVERILVLGSPEISENDIDNLVTAQKPPLRLVIKHLVNQMGGPEKMIAYVKKEFMEKATLRG